MHAHMQAFINKQNRASERMLIEFFFQDFAPKYGLSDANLTFEQIKAMPEMLNYPADTYIRTYVHAYIYICMHTYIHTHLYTHIQQQVP